MLSLGPKCCVRFLWDQIGLDCVLCKLTGVSHRPKSEDWDPQIIQPPTLYQIQTPTPRTVLSVTNIP